LTWYDVRKSIKKGLLLKPRRTHFSNKVFRLVGGTEDNDLWVEKTTSDDGPCIRSVWEPTDDERRRIAAGENIYLVVWGDGTPPVALGVTDDALGKPL
jgi:hypothetical protein